MTRVRRAAILGSGNIGTDLMVKIVRHGRGVELAAMAGLDPASSGLARARSFGVATNHAGVTGLLTMPAFDRVDLVFDATSAAAHADNDAKVRAARPDVQVIDLTPAAIGPFCVPVVNGYAHAHAPNVNLVTCGGQATIPIVAAIGRVAPVHYAEIVASIASRSAGPGTRSNIDEFTATTARALESVGGAARGKAIIVFNPAEPPLVMRDTVYTLSDEADEVRVVAAVEAAVAAVQRYVPGYQLVQRVQTARLSPDRPLRIPGAAAHTSGLVTTVYLAVAGAAHHLPAYAGNLDIMTSAALAVAEQMATHRV